MRYFSIFLAILVAISFAAAPADAGFQRIKKYENVKLIIGKRLYDEAGNWVRFNSNGTMSGKHKTLGAVTGKWSLSSGSICRTMNMGNVSDTDCQWVALDGNKVRFVRRKGTGKAHILYIK